MQVKMQVKKKKKKKDKIHLNVQDTIYKNILM